MPEKRAELLGQSTNSNPNSINSILKKKKALLFALEQKRANNKNSKEIKDIAEQIELTKHEIAFLSIKRLKFQTETDVNSAFVGGIESLPKIPWEAFVVLESLGSNHAQILATSADMDTLVIDDSILLTASPNYHGWNPNDIRMTVVDYEPKLPQEIQDFMQRRIKELENSRFVNNRLYRLLSFVPDLDDFGKLSITLFPTTWFNYYSIAENVHKPILELGSDLQTSIIKKFGPNALKLGLSRTIESGIPNVVSIKGIILTNDKKIVITKRSGVVSFQHSHWSASFEETMSIRDTSFFDAAIRGFREEFGSIAASTIKDIKVLSINYEYETISADACCLIRLNASSNDVRNSWRFARDKDEAALIDFIPLELDRTVELLLTHRVWHPSSRMRLVQTLFHYYGIADTLIALYRAFDAMYKLKTKPYAQIPVKVQLNKAKSTNKSHITEQQKIAFLFLAADPSNASRLRLGEEMREIQEKLQIARYRDQLELHQRMSVRPTDISQALLDVQPQIVHFSGHGAATGALCFENQLGETHLVEPNALAGLFEQFATQVSCVILNACYSEIQANAISRHIDYVIGMNQAIGDKAAIAFSIGFYQALGAGRTIEEAYKLGVVQIRLQGIPEHLTPVLIKKEQAQP